MNVQAVKDWMKALPKEEGDNCVFLLSSDGDFACKVDGTVGVIAAMLLQMAMRNPAFAGALLMAAGNICMEGGAE